MTKKDIQIGLIHGGMFLLMATVLCLYKDKIDLSYKEIIAILLIIYLGDLYSKYLQISMEETLEKLESQKQLKPATSAMRTTDQKTKE